MLIERLFSSSFFALLDLLCQSIVVVAVVAVVVLSRSLSCVTLLNGIKVEKTLKIHFPRRRRSLFIPFIIYQWIYGGVGGGPIVLTYNA